jgi:hypothetical protein
VKNRCEAHVRWTAREWRVQESAFAGKRAVPPPGGSLHSCGYLSIDKLMFIYK